jgi:hypothetical protein
MRLAFQLQDGVNAVNPVGARLDSTDGVQGLTPSYALRYVLALLGSNTARKFWPSSCEPLRAWTGEEPCDGATVFIPARVSLDRCFHEVTLEQDHPWFPNSLVLEMKINDLFKELPT